MKCTKIFSLLTVFLVSLIAVCSMASAASVVSIDEVKVNGDIVNPSAINKYDFDKDQNLEVKVRLSSPQDIDNIQIEGTIRGYDHNDLMEDITDVFDMSANVTYSKTLKIPLRLRMDQDTYKLRISVADRDGDRAEKTYELVVNTKSHRLDIKDVVLSPESEVKAGRALLAKVRVKNYGEKDEKGIKITASIADIGASDSDYIDEIEKDGNDDDEVTSEELYLRIPNCAEAGDYKVKVEVTYDDGDEKATKIIPIKIVDGDICEVKAVEAKKAEEKTILTIGPESQAVVQGATAVYPITISNAGSTSKTYTISVDSANGGTVSISPSNVVVLDSGESKAVYVQFTPAKASAGEQIFAVTVKSNEKVLKQVALKAIVSGAAVADQSKLRRALEVGLVVIVVILVLLGLIIGFNKLKGSDEGSKEEGGSTYY